MKPLGLARTITMNQFWRANFILAGMLPMLAFGASRPEPNAFLDDSVKSAAQLVRQVKSKPDVRDRYMRHFGMTELQVCSYLGSLRLQSVSRPEVVTVYSVPGSGEVKSHRQTLRKGELVFVDPSGRRALLARCGNPLAMGPTNMLNMAMATPSLEGSDVLAMRAVKDLTVEPVMMTDPGPTIAMTEPPDTIADVVSDVPPIVASVITAPPLTPAVTPAAAPAPPSVGGNNGSALALLPLLGGGALLGILASNHGGGGVTPVPAPEPATILALAVGGVALLKRRRR